MTSRYSILRFPFRCKFGRLRNNYRSESKARKDMIEERPSMSHFLSTLCCRAAIMKADFIVTFDSYKANKF